MNNLIYLESGYVARMVNFKIVGLALCYTNFIIRRNFHSHYIKFDVLLLMVYLFIDFIDIVLRKMIVAHVFEQA